MAKRILSVLLVALMLTSVLAGCTPTEEQPPRSFQIERFDYKPYLGTSVIAVYSFAGDDKSAFDANCAAVREILERTTKLFDIYYEYSGVNNICTVNRGAGNGEPVTVDPLIIDLIEYGREAYTLTGGKTNIALGSVLSLWHDCREDAQEEPPILRLPDPDALTEAMKHTDISKVVTDREKSTVYLSDPEMSLDVGAVAKGFATDLIRDLLVSRGAKEYYLNIGGTVVDIGGARYEMGLTNPDPAEREPIATLLLENAACITSGNYHNYYYVEGKRYHHLIDTDTLYPAEYHSSVSVISPSSALGDALSTALFCMSYEDGAALVKSIGGIEVMWISADYKTVRTTDGFYNHIKK